MSHLCVTANVLGTSLLIIWADYSPLIH